MLGVVLAVLGNGLALRAAPGSAALRVDAPAPE
jgi:hypothetical protein